MGTVWGARLLGLQVTEATGVLVLKVGALGVWGFRLGYSGGLGISRARSVTDAGTDKVVSC